MRELVPTRKFERAYRKFVRKNPSLQSKIDDVLRQLRDDAFAPSLGTHKLSGRLFGLFACTCGYDCRIVFSIEKKELIDEEFILLIDIGTHDEVY
jgi:mRNA-degrading endonuclease YafQ of YafQ-DinJ toxin-antitoxin module